MDSIKEKTILLATGNPGKLSELRKITADFGFSLTCLSDLSLKGDAPETGQTFLENAKQKAEYYFQKAGIPVFADDSGLQVDALNGQPGIHSARFGGFQSHAERRTHLLKLLEDVAPDQRTARFRCAAIYYDGTSWFTAEGKVEGFITLRERGDGGFGYDPVFAPEWNGPTYAQLSQDEKNMNSHRANAFHALFKNMGLE